MSTGIQMVPLPAKRSSMKLLFNGKIVTVDDAFSIVDAIAIEGDTIVAVGEEVRQLDTAGAEMIDLRGATVVPGLIDSRLHASWAGLAIGDVDLMQARSIADVLEAIAERVKVTPAGEWVRSHPAWVEGMLKERRFPTPEELDSVAPDHPVYLKRTGFTVVLNSCAKRLLGVSAETREEVGNSIIRDERGEPAVFVGPHSALLATDKPATLPDWVEGLQAIAREMNSFGVTGFTEPVVPPPAMRAYQQLWATGKLSVRVNLMLSDGKRGKGIPSYIDEYQLSSGFGDTMLRVSALAQVGLRDGVPGALMREPYTWMDGDEKGYRGIDTVVDWPDGTTFADSAVMAARNGWRLGLGCSGDAMLDWSMDLFERIRQEVPEMEFAAQRHIACHPFFLHDDQLKRMKDLGLVVQSELQGYLFSENIRKYWGEERAAAAFPIRKLFDNEVVVGLGSDGPILPINPFVGMSYFVTRETPTGVEGVEHGLTREQALRGYTINGAYLTCEEKLKGSLEPGKLADLAVLSDDILTCPDSDIANIRSVMTMLGGQIVYDDRPDQ